jgi:hypothetical protein
MGDYFYPAHPPHKKQRDAVMLGPGDESATATARRDCTVLYAPFSPIHNCMVITLLRCVEPFRNLWGSLPLLPFVSFRVRRFYPLYFIHGPSPVLTRLDLRLSLSH